VENRAVVKEEVDNDRTGGFIGNNYLIITSLSDKMPSFGTQPEQAHELPKTLSAGAPVTKMSLPVSNSDGRSKNLLPVLKKLKSGENSEKLIANAKHP
jgi:hypothetical protein